MSDYRAEMRAIRKAYMQFQDAGDPEGCVGFWHPDGVLMPPNEPAIRGHADLLMWYRAAFAAFDFDVKIEYEQAISWGDWGFARGSYTGTVTPRATGEPTEDRGKILEVLRRQPDGTWKWHAHTWNSDLPSG
jgi:ketosteroid isomerase-like protein